MKITDTAVDRSTTTIVLLVIFLITGTYSYWTLPRESAPEIVIPIINVTTPYEGVTPTDMESLVTVPIERKLTGLADVKEITSVSAEGMSSITIEFVADTDINESLQKVRDKVDLAKSDLPEDADDPIISEINFADFPIMMMSLRGDIGLAALNEIAEDLEDRIEAIQGVLDVSIIGGVEREIQIVVDPDRVAEYGVSLAELAALARVENVNTPAGSMDLGEAKFNVRTPGEFRRPEEISDLVVKQGAIGNVYLRDIAEVRDGFKEVTSLSRVNGLPSITIAVSKRSGENIIRIADTVREEVAEFKSGLPPGIEIDVTQDQSDDVRSMVSELQNSIFSGLILVLLVIFMFLGFTNAWLVALAIPVSMFISFTTLSMMSITLNFVVLFSLILALGMLVDNGIVIVENIYRHYQHGEERHQAAKAGASEVAWPIIGSTLTTIAAFFPMMFWPGIMGEFMFYLPFTVSLALIASLFVGLIMNPALASLVMRGKRHQVENGRIKRHLVLRGYRKLLGLALRWRTVTIMTAVTALAAIVGVYAMNGRMEFMPDTEPQRAYIDVEAPEGTNLATSDGIVRQIERVVEPFRDNIDFVISSIGSQADASMGALGGASNSSSHRSRVTLEFPKLEDMTIAPSQILHQVREGLSGITGAKIRIEKQENGPPTGPPVNVEISGDDFETLASLSEQVQDKIRDVSGLVDLRDDYNKGKPEVRVVVDRQQAARTGLNTQFIGETVKAAVNGTKAGDFREGDDEYDVTVRFPDRFRSDMKNLENMNLINLAGQSVPFSSVARVEEGAGLGVVRRIDRNRTVTVSAEVEGTRSGAQVLQEVRARLEGMQMPAGYTISYTGENEEMEESMAFLFRAFVVAVLLVGLVLITQFNSVLQSFIILSSVVLSLAGVFVGLLVFDMAFGVIMTGIGCISLAGVVVNNAIVLVDFVNQLRATGMPVRDALIEAGVTRFRPVMLTAITTILGLIPMAAGISYDFAEFRWIVGGESSQWWGPMAVAVIFGLAFATLLTLVVVPTLYSILEDLKGFARVAVTEPKTETIGAPAK